MTRQFKVFSEEGVKNFECALKHLSGIHALGWEHITTITSSQLIEEEGDVGDIIRKTMLLSSTTTDIEDIIMAYMTEFLLKDVATATSEQMRVEEADLKQFIWQYGHFVLVEEHYADYISGQVKKLQNAESEAEKKAAQEKILKLCKFLYTTRTVRKKYLSGFLEKVQSGNPPNDTKGSEAAQNETG